MIELTELEKLVLAFVASSCLLILVGLAVDDRLRQRAQNHGWTKAANRLSHRQTQLHRKVEQLESHLGHLAAELERTRAQVAARPPSDPTVRLGMAPGRTERLARLDPSWPNNRSN